MNMDRLLCKAKRIDNGEWVIGNFIYYEVHESYYIMPRVGPIWDHDETYMDNDRCITFSVYEVDPFTISKCTGLKDKNGQLIFEGDNIQCRFNGYSSGRSAFIGGETNCGKVYRFGSDFCVNDVSLNSCFDILIINNIHDKVDQ